MDNAEMVNMGYPRLKGKYSQIAAAKKKIKIKNNNNKIAIVVNSSSSSWSL